MAVDLSMGWRLALRQILSPVCGGLALALVSSVGSTAYELKTLYSFCAKANCTDGSLPAGELLLDAAGNLYGTTQDGGDVGRGVVFGLTYDAGQDKWTYKTIYSFCRHSDCRRGNPNDPLIIDTSGNLYGTAGSAAFKLSPSDSGQWSFTRLHKFNDKNQSGLGPSSGLAYAGIDTGAPYDGRSPLYGVTDSGGTGSWPNHCTGCGVLYQLQPHRKGWRETVLYDFCVQGNGCPDGWFPARSLAVGASGTLYGTTFGGGTKNKGVVYALSGSTLTVLHSFCTMNHCADGDGGDGLIRDAQENLYGEADTNSGGVIFQIVPSGKFKSLYAFCQLGSCADGEFPAGRLLLDSAGDIFGPALLGGANGEGVAYKLSGGTESVLYDFCSKLNCADGEGPDSGFVMDASGDLFGTTLFGGDQGQGTVFELVP